MTEAEFKQRTKQLALETIRAVSTIPRGVVSDPLVRQLVRSATSVGANYRAACRARSKTEMIAKLGVVEEECDETLYWIELVTESGISSQADWKAIQLEAEQILSMVVASIRTARASIGRVRETVTTYGSLSLETADSNGAVLDESTKSPEDLSLSRRQPRNSKSAIPNPK